MVAPKMSLDSSFEKTCRLGKTFRDSWSGFNFQPSCYQLGNNWEGLEIPKCPYFSVPFQNQDTSVTNNCSSYSDFLDFTLSDSSRKLLPRRRRRRRTRKVLTDYKPDVRKKLTMREKIIKRIGDKFSYQDKDILTILPQLKTKANYAHFPKTNKKSDFSNLLTSGKFCKKGLNLKTGLLCCVQESILTPTDSSSCNGTSSLSNLQCLSKHMDRIKYQNEQTFAEFSHLKNML